ncbi:helix-turn-helix domain-containing protein [Streptomyces chiangmaiensis]|uniref:GAF domain-containing protein n=1 Tax=Streptomyces chiangmaiensis TaxID=766497 RepID=A0ABU7FAF1_9ACTN|nr:GAF domain-containing protein [Streptomyces chiangmaiensis]MED7821053.1 GAF domain-containing protein [Streptomyces chiangmaiensis]
MAHSDGQDVTRLAARDAAQAARVLNDVRNATLAGQRAPVPPRPVIEASWGRMLRSGVDPDHDFRAELLGRDEIERRRQDSPLRHVLPVLREGLLSVADVAQHIMVVADADGRVLWREGSSPVLRKADGMGFEPGADWGEGAVGTNGVGTAAVTRRPVQVFASEHFLRSLATWTCAGAPITDPRDGRLLGVVDLSGPLETMHPATLAWVDAVAKLAEARLRELHLNSLERLRAVAAPLLAKLGGRALAIDTDGWTAAVTGMPYTGRVALPASLPPGLTLLPALGPCTVEPLPGGWLIRIADAPAPTHTTRVVVDVAHPRRWSVTVSGDTGSWTHELSPRHAELLYLLALHRPGRTAAALASDMFGDPARTVTVRAEMSRVRRYLGAFLEHRPYRFCDAAEVELLVPADPCDLLPHSVAPAVLRARDAFPGGAGEEPSPGPPGGPRLALPLVPHPGLQPRRWE